MWYREGHPNRLGLKGWIAGGRWGPDRYLYALHRLTGLGLVVYFIAHIIVTSSRALGQESWESAMGTVSGGIWVLGLLGLAEVGIGTGAPIEPVYPYKTSLDAQRPWAILALLAVAAIVVVGTLDFFVWH